MRFILCLNSTLVYLFPDISDDLPVDLSCTQHLKNWQRIFCKLCKKMIISCQNAEKEGKFSFAVCSKGVGSNSTHCHFGIC